MLLEFGITISMAAVGSMALMDWGSSNSRSSRESCESRRRWQHCRYDPVVLVVDVNAIFTFQIKSRRERAGVSQVRGAGMQSQSLFFRSISLSLPL